MGVSVCPFKWFEMGNMHLFIYILIYLLESRWVPELYGRLVYTIVTRERGRERESAESC